MHSSRFYLDLLERAVWTFVQGFAAVLIIQGHFTILSLYAGATAGGLAICKAIVAGQFGNTNSAALPETKGTGGVKK